MKKGNLLYGQSGGPSAVINASAYGVIKEAILNEEVDQVLVMNHGIEGALEEDFHYLNDYVDQIELLPNTPASAFGSCRYKINAEQDLPKLVEIFKKYNIRYFLYNGGNDSMDTCVKVNDYCKEVGYELYTIGVPKTVDNDLPFTDHTPGFSSAAKFIINTMMQIKLDSEVYKKGKVTIVEIMGRHAGWLTASSSVATKEGMGPDLIYLPERPMDLDVFLEEVKNIYSKQKNCLIAVSEGVKDKTGNFIGMMNQKKDAFGHTQLGGVALTLGGIIEDKLGLKYRAVELSTVQRSASFMRSKTDVIEAIEVGREAVRRVVSKETGRMVVIKRISNDPYIVEYDTHDVREIANLEQIIPDSMIGNDNFMMTQEFFDYIYPLIDGGYKQSYSRGTQDFFQINKNKKTV